MASQEIPVNATALSASAPDNISLRIITLAHGSSGENDLYLVLNLDTKVGQLKDRLQQELPQHPRPDCQRLIYQGRPLLDNNAALRSILRLQPPNSNTPAAHVLHLVVRQDQPQSTTPTPSNRAQPAQTPQSVPQGLHPLPQAQPPFFPQPGVQGINAVQALMQQHMAIHNRNVANPHPTIPQINAVNIPHFHAMGGLPVQPQVAANHGQQQPQRQETASPSVAAGSPGIPTPGIPTITEQTSIHHGMTTRIQETIGPNGERIRTVVNSGSFLPNHIHNLQPNPEERPASAPPSALPPAMSATTDQPQDPRVAAMFPGMQFPNFPAAGRPMMHQLGSPFGLQQASRPAQSTIAWLLSSPTGPQAVVFAPGYGNFTTIPTEQATRTDAPSSANTTGNNQSTQNEAAQAPGDGPAGNNAQNQAPLQVAIRPDGQAQAQGLGQPQAAVRPQAREGEDLLALILQRGWLFLRLYMFIFVLSESGTWRRIALLSLAVFVCLLPRRNPLTDGFNAARRHVDNLIGPPQPPQRQGQPAREETPGQNRTGNGQQPQSNQDNNATASDEANAANQQSRRSQMPSPEEHARRLLREHRAQNPSFIRGLLYSVEQAVALFLASLIPGVGERHVRAREDARRIVQEAEERRIREAEQSNQQTEGGSSGEQPTTVADTLAKKTGAEASTSNAEGANPVAGMSTGVETNASTANTLSAQSSSEGIRQRIGEGSA